MSIHKNSVASFREIKPRLQGRRKKIFDLFQLVGEPMTDRDVKNRLGLDDMNQVRPRITELIDWQYLEDCGERVDQKTKKRVRLCRVKPARPQQLSLGGG